MQLEAKKDDVPVPQNVNGCGTCYGAESATRKCCETCEDIRQAYREKGWSFSNARNMAQVCCIFLLIIHNDLQRDYIIVYQ